MRTIRIEYPSYYKEVAKHLGEKREKASAAIAANNPRYQRPNPDKVNQLGLLGELIVLHFLEGKNESYIHAPFVEETPYQGPDVEWNGKLFDIKTCNENARYLLVNAEAAQKLKGVSHYWFVKILNDREAQMWVFPKEDVSKWPVKNFGYTDAHYMQI